PFPTPLDDCDRALNWARESFQDDGGSRPQFVLAGSSSGGNLAAALAIRSRDRQDADIDLQLLIYPALDARASSDSYADNAEGAFLSAAQMRWYWNQYASVASL